MNGETGDNGVLAARGVELRHLRALVALAQELHYSRAAIRLHVAQSTLSRTIADLEGLVGTSLVDRTHRTVALTEGGRALAGVSEQTLAGVQHGVAAARSAPLTLGLLGTYGFRWLPALRERIGALTVRTVAPDEGFTALTRDVTLVVGAMPIVEPAHLAFRTLACTDAWIALPACHPLAATDPLPFARIAREPLVLPRADATWRGHVELIYRAHGLPVRHGPDATCMAEVLALVAAGRGWSMACAREELHPWDGVELRRVTDLDRTRIAVAWDPARLPAEAQRVVDALLDLSSDVSVP